MFFQEVNEHGQVLNPESLNLNLTALPLSYLPLLCLFYACKHNSSRKELEKLDRKEKKRGIRKYKPLFCPSFLNQMLELNKKTMEQVFEMQLCFFTIFKRI